MVVRDGYSCLICGDIFMNWDSFGIVSNKSYDNHLQHSNTELINSVWPHFCVRVLQAVLWIFYIVIIFLCNKTFIYLFLIPIF